MKSFSLSEFNSLSEKEAKEALLFCCGSSRWVDKLALSRPFSSLRDLKEKGANIWLSLFETDWVEAFSHHPKIGDLDNLKKKFASTQTWAEEEQKGSKEASEELLRELARANQTYENRFGYIFIVCATGKTAVEMLEILRQRINNDPKEEIKLAALEQGKITAIRLEKLIHE